MKDKFIDDLKETMLSVAPADLWRRVQNHADFYRIICRRACLSPSSPYALQAFNELIAEMEQRKIAVGENCSTH